MPDVTDHAIPALVSLEDRVAVVTGAARGIGRAICRRFGEAGARVVMADLHEGEVRSAAEALGLTQTAVLPAEVDVRSEESVAKLADVAMQEFGRIDVWVNNAGVFPVTPALELDLAQWHQVVDVNLTGAFVGAREAAKRMIQGRHSGVIVNLASVAAYRASPLGGTEYVSAKHGVVGLTKSLAAQLGPHDIRVLGLAPTTIDTPGLRASRQEVQALGAAQVDAERIRPLGRDGVPDDVARVALFCASDLAMLMTGSTLLIDGGTLSLQ